ncbi:MAG: malate dehydrogenase [Candidatus Hydrogenedentota bacterium]|nr:MAG: malate dehydrogenase [Candidatus Hydrogenedentota bacterium]
MGNTITVTVTGAAGQIGYSILPRIASGEVFGPETRIRLRLLEITPAMPALEGVVMELDDCAFPLLESITPTDDPETAFDGVNWALLIGSRPRTKGMERNDLIRVNGPIFVGQGQALQSKAASDVRVVVVGNPCNTNCLIAMRNAPEIPSNRFSAMTFLDQNRAQAQLAKKAGVPVSDVTNVTIWGNHSATQYPDAYNARIRGKPAAEVIGDEGWIRSTFLETVQKRGAAIIAARGLSSAMSAANAAIDHVRAFLNPTRNGTWFSAAVPSDGSYGVDEGLVFSFPLTSDGQGGYRIVPEIPWNDFAREKISATLEELRKEKSVVTDLLPT